MLPYLCANLGKRPSDKFRQKKWEHKLWDLDIEAEFKYPHQHHTVPFNQKVLDGQTRFSKAKVEIKEKKKVGMASKISNFTDLIHRVTASCLTQPLARAGNAPPVDYESEIPKCEDEEEEDQNDEEEEEEEEDDYVRGFKSWEAEEKREGKVERVKDMEGLMADVFEAVWAMKKAYVTLQKAHSPWDPEKMMVADMAVVGELKRLGRLRERFRRGGSRAVGWWGPVREGVVEPYVAAVEELKREVKTKEAEVASLKEKLKSAQKERTGKKERFYASHRKVSCSQAAIIASTPTPELFESGMLQLKQALNSFTSLLLSYMNTARWDIASAVRSIMGPSAISSSAVESSPHHAKHALESYVSHKIFEGFENENFYLEGTLSSLLHPDKFRRDCFSHYRDMKAMDPSELLGILPMCHFGKFCCKKYLAILHEKMEESLFGNLEQRVAVLGGSHPRSEFYGAFLGLAKAVWLLHLLAFALDPAPGHFQAHRGAEFHPEYMESVVRYAGGRAPIGQVVGFPVTPGFKLGNGSVIKARVYLVPRT